MHAPRKRRRLLFTSELSRRAIEQYDEQGNETVQWLQYQSAQRLKAKWEGIFDRFKDAHLQEQDELYLGNVANGEPLVVIKDRGSLRALKKPMNFGDFIKDEELQGWKSRLQASGDSAVPADEDDDDDDEDGQPQHYTDAESDNDEQGEEVAENDPDLREFLEAGARRKSLHALHHLDDDGEEDAIDLNDLHWTQDDADTSTSTRVWKPPSRLNARRKATRSPSSSSHNARNPPILAASSASSDAEDSDDTADAITVYSDSDDELEESIAVKRQNVEDLLHCTTPFNTLPYNDVFGLADLLGLPDHTSRLYLDYV